jgi:hypothetical protein
MRFWFGATRAVWSVVGSFVVLVGCAGDSGDTDVALDPTFTNVHTTVLQPTCAFSSCHGSADAGDLTLTDAAASYDALVDAPSAGDPAQILVVPGDPDASYLVHKLEAASGIVGDPMPPPAGGLEPEKVALIRAWIAAGAPND